MKIGLRKPNPMGSLKAKTTGRMKRAAKSTFNPYYGRKGSGLINNPRKSVYNKIYSKTTTSIFDSSLYSNKQKSHSDDQFNQETFSGQTIYTIDDHKKIEGLDQPDVNPNHVSISKETKSNNSDAGSGTAAVTFFFVIGCAVCGNWLGAVLSLVIGTGLYVLIRKSNSN